MNAAQAHKSQVWKEFSNIKDTLPQEIIQNVHKHQKIRKAWPFNVSQYFYLVFVQLETKIYFNSSIIYLATETSSHSDSLWKCSKCLGSLCELVLPERGVSTQDSGEMINTGMQYRFCSNSQLSCDGVTAKLMGNISLNYRPPSHSYIC